MLRTEAEVKAMLSIVEKRMTGEEDSEDPVEVIHETLLWMLCAHDDNAVLDLLPEEDDGSDDEG